RVVRLHRHVSEDWIGNPGLRPGDHSLAIDRAVHFELALGERHHRAAFAFLRRGVVLHGRLQKAMRGEPDLELAFVCGGERRLGSIARLVPGILATDEIDLLLFAREWPSAAVADGSGL